MFVKNGSHRNSFCNFLLYNPLHMSFAEILDEIPRLSFANGFVSVAP